MNGLEERIQVRIFPDGRIFAETKGIKGEKCTDYLKILEELLNAETVKSAYTDEFYEVEQVHTQQNQRIDLNNDR